MNYENIFHWLLQMNFITAFFVDKNLVLQLFEMFEKIELKGE